jgi:2'-hydroxyisoflavone reductase
MRRRELLVNSALTLLAGCVGRAMSASSGRLRLLILGGTRFLGIHTVEYALARGHEVTIFTRGQHEADLGNQVKRLIGNRDGKLDALKGGTWDAVIDDSGFVPRHVRLSAELLAATVAQYVFISSISVYDDLAQPRDEGSPIATIDDPAAVEKVDQHTYGPLKALCEQAAQRAFPGRCTVIRPGLIVGPHDYTDRFTYWPARAAKGGEILAPGKPRDRIQFIDARDLAAFCVHSIENRSYGIFNALSPPGTFTMGALLAASRVAALQLAKPKLPIGVTWVPAAFLNAQKVEPWSDMPVWIPESGDYAAAAEISARRAQSAGLRIRALSGTVYDTLRWHLSRPPAEQLKLQAGLSADREALVLDAWHKQLRRGAADVSNG